MSMVGAGFLEGWERPRETLSPLLVLGGPQEVAPVSPLCMVQSSPEQSTEEGCHSGPAPCPGGSLAGCWVAGLLCRAAVPSSGVLGSREAISSCGSQEHPLPRKCGPGPCWCLPALQATAHRAVDRLVTGPLAGWLGRLVNILRNDLAKGSGTTCHRGAAGWLACFFFFLFQLSALFLPPEGQPPPLPASNQGGGWGSLPFGFLAEG